MRMTCEQVKSGVLINLTNKVKTEKKRITLSKDTITKREENYGNKKVQELKIIYKKLTAKALIFNFERGNYEEVERDLKRLISTINSNSLNTEIILIDLYFSIYEFQKGSIKKFLSNVNRCLSKIDKIDLNFEIYFDESDKILFEKFIFNSCNSLIKEIFSHESTFRCIVPELFQTYEGFIANLLSKDHFSSFVYFFAILCLTKKNQGKLKDQFIKQFKEKTSISTHTTIDIKMNSISSLSETDLFCVQMRDIINRIESNLIINEKESFKGLKKQSKEKLLRIIDIYSINNSSSPSTRRKLFERSKEKLSKKATDTSNYQKYIKNLKNIRIRDSITPIPTKTKVNEIVKSNKQSLEKKLSDTTSEKSKKQEKDDSSSTNHYSNTNIVNNSNINKIKIIPSYVYQFDNIKAEENSEEIFPSNKVVNIIEKIDSKLNDMNSQILSFGQHIQDLRNFLSEY